LSAGIPEEKRPAAVSAITCATRYTDKVGQAFMCRKVDRLTRG
jgi:hypothetical protein